MRQTATIFLASNFDEFRTLRNFLIANLQTALRGRAIVESLEDAQARPNAPLDESRRRVRDCDLCVVLIGDQYGGIPPGQEKSYAHLEYLEAIESATTDVLVFTYDELSPPPPRSEPSTVPVSEDPRVLEWRAHAEQLSTVATISRSQRGFRKAREQVREHIMGWLLERLAKDAVVPSAGASGMASSFSLGPAIEISPDDRWRSDEISQLDLNIMGTPSSRDAETGTGLVAQANDEWNEACKAFEIKSSDIMSLHLERAVDLRPLDGETRYWLARLQMIKASTDEEGLTKVSEGAVAAARVFDAQTEGEKGREADDSDARTGLAWLLAAKASRGLGDFAAALSASEEAVNWLGRHSETHLERSLAFAGNGEEEQSIVSARRAFNQHIYVLDSLEEQLDGMQKVSLYTKIRDRLSDEVRGHLEMMHKYSGLLGEYLGEALYTEDIGERLKGDDPIALVEEGQYIAVEHLDRTRDASRIVSDASDSLSEAESLVVTDRRQEVRESMFDVGRLIRWTVLVAIAIGAAVGVATQVPLAAAIAVGIMVVIGASAGVLKNAENQQRTEAAAAEHSKSVEDKQKRVDRATEKYNDVAERFELICTEFERTHLMSKHYSPGPPPRWATDGDPVRLKRSDPKLPIESDDALTPDLRRRLRGSALKSDGVKFGLYEVEGRKRSSRRAVRWRVYSHPDAM